MSTESRNVPPGMKVVELSDQEVATMRRFQQPVERWEALAQAARMAQGTFLQHLLQAHDAHHDPSIRWEIDLESGRLIGKPGGSGTIPGGGGT